MALARFASVSFVSGVPAAALALAFGAGCTTDLRDAESFDGPGGASSVDAAVVAATMTRQVVRVRGDGRPVAHARVATRDARGTSVDVGFTDGSGVAHVRVVDGGVVVAAASGFSAGARLGAGDVNLAPLAAPERAVPRLRDGGGGVEVVVEVVRGDDVTAPRAPGLAAAPSSTALPPTRFVDVAGHPAAAHIEALASRGVVAGDPGGRFRPDDPLTRAELVALVLRTAGIADSAPSSSSTAAFSDVDSCAWYAAPVATARALEIVRGDPDGRFRPSDAVTRAELAAVMVKVGAVPLVDTAPADVLPNDLPASHWAARALVSTLSFCHLVDLDDAGAVRADAVATRADAAVAVSRLLSCAADRGLSPGSLLARHAADDAWATHRAHHEGVAATGLGTHYGDTSAFHRLSLADKRAYVEAHKRPGTTPLDPTQMTRSSCIEYAMELTSNGYADLGRADEWRIVDDRARAQGLRGTELAADLVAAGWRAIYVNADSAYAGITGPDHEHSFSLAVARNEQTYYDVPLSGALLDWEHDDAKKQAMSALPFGVLVLRGGFHVVAIADGAVHELARSEGPDGHVLYDDVWSDILKVYADDVYGGGDVGNHKAHAMWGSGVLVVPPGVELDGVEGL